MSKKEWEVVELIPPQLIVLDGLIINKVKRLSDGEIFEVGEKVIYKSDYRIIAKMEQHYPPDLDVGFENGNWVSLKEIEKHPLQKNNQNLLT